MGASGFHEGEKPEEGADDARVVKQIAANKVGLEMDRYIVTMEDFWWVMLWELAHFLNAEKQQTLVYILSRDHCFWLENKMPVLREGRN
jgi:hypothetical protein